MDGFKNSTKTQYMQGDRDLVDKVARKLDPKKSVVVGEIKPLYRDRDTVAKAARKLDPKGAVMVGDTAQYNKGGKVAAKKGVPAHSSKPMIGRNKGGLSAMPKGKCKITQMNCLP